MTEAADIFAQQEANRLRSRWLIVGFVFFFVWLGVGGDVLLHERIHLALGTSDRFPWMTASMTVTGIAFVWFAWSTGSQRVLWATGAERLVVPLTPAEKQLADVVEEMAIASGIPKPQIWIVPDPDPNAFATGRDELTASIAVTQGLLETCSRDELQAVIGHEMGHIKNLDVRLMTLLAALVGAVALFSNGGSRAFGAGGRRGDDRTGPSTAIIVLLGFWAVSFLLAPLVTRLLALAVSRDREYLADAMSAQFTRNPIALANALEKIDGAPAPTTRIKGGAAHLCIADPLGRPVNGRSGFLANLLGTHPPIASRIERLKAMAYAPAA